MPLARCKFHTRAPKLDALLAHARRRDAEGGLQAAEGSPVRSQDDVLLDIRRAHDHEMLVHLTNETHRRNVGCSDMLLFRPYLSHLPGVTN
jgi:hypothetical protein